MRKLGKKLLALTLVSSMAAAALAGCGGSDNKTTDGAKDTQDTAQTEESTSEGSKTSSEAQSLKVAAFAGGNGTEIWEKIKTAFEESHDGVTVELQTSSELDQDLTKEIQNGNFPDVVYYNLGQPSGFTETMLKENAVADISDIFDAELKGRLVDGILDGTDAQPYNDGKIYLAPIFPAVLNGKAVAQRIKATLGITG